MAPGLGFKFLPKSCWGGGCPQCHWVSVAAGDAAGPAARPIWWDPRGAAVGSRGRGSSRFPALVSLVSRPCATSTRAPATLKSRGPDRPLAWWRAPSPGAAPRPGGGRPGLLWARWWVPPPSYWCVPGWTRRDTPGSSAASVQVRHHVSYPELLLVGFGAAAAPLVRPNGPGRRTASPCPRGAQAAGWARETGSRAEGGLKDGAQRVVSSSAGSRWRPGGRGDAQGQGWVQ